MLFQHIQTLKLDLMVYDCTIVLFRDYLKFGGFFTYSFLSAKQGNFMARWYFWQSGTCNLTLLKRKAVKLQIALVFFSDLPR